MPSLINPVYAQGQVVTIEKPPGIRITDIGTIISGVIGTVFIIAGVIIFAYLVFGGILYITSSGDKSQTERGQNAMTGAMIGFAIIAASYAIVLILEYVFGYSIVGTLNIPTFY